MTFTKRIKKIVPRLDKYSPYPLFYPFDMTRAEKTLFDAAIKKSRNYLEFGMGGSTIRAIQKSRAKVFTVDSNPGWIAYMRGYKIVRYFENKRLFIFPVDIGPVVGWGYPKPGNSEDLFERYSSNIFNSIDTKIVDLALVDGRFRVACTLKIILKCHNNDNINILIHDFWNRDKYHIVLKYLDTIDKIDTIGLFSIKKNVDLKLAEREYETYKVNPF